MDHCWYNSVVELFVDPGVVVARHSRQGEGFPSLTNGNLLKNLKGLSELDEVG